MRKSAHMYAHLPLLDIIMRRKMTQFGHITRHDSMKVIEKEEDQRQIG